MYAVNYTENGMRQCHISEYRDLHFEFSADFDYLDD